MSDILENLNEEQKKAVTHTDGPIMIIAGAGTGKTTVMTKRIAWLIENDLAKPDEILALTFTEKAASEMEERVDQILPYGYVDLWISTFHSFCQRILEEHAIDIGLASDVKLVSELDAWMLMRQNIDKFDLDYYKPLGNPTKFLRSLLQHFSRAKDENVGPEEYKKYVDSLEKTEYNEDELIKQKEIATAYATYEQILHNADALDFGGLIQYTIKLFKKRSSIRKKFQKQFKYIIVDEFQDTNHAQYELIKLLVNRNENIAIVGDDDQAIYTFRGASINNILSFEEDFPNTKKVVLTKNYRSTQEILDKAYDFIQQNNPNRLEVKLKETHGLNKRLESQTVGKGIVKHFHCNTMEDEAIEVINKIKELHDTLDCEWSDFAILVRANNHAQPFLEKLDKEKIPYRFLALSGLYQKPIILDTIALLRAVDRPYDNPSIYRILSHPVLGVKENDLIKLLLLAKKNGTDYETLIRSNLKEISQESKEALKTMTDFLSKMREETKTKTALEMFAKIFKASGLKGTLLTLPEEQQHDQIHLLKQFYERIQRFTQISEHKNLHSFLNEFEEELTAGEGGSLRTQASQSGPDEVQIMTIHGSKGLEFRFVFIVSMVSQRFPASRRSVPIPLPEQLMHHTQKVGDPHIEEERRLMYVGATRAKEQLYLTSACDYGGARKKKISKFLLEMGFQEQDSLISHNVSFLKEKQDHIANPKIHIEVPTSFSFTQLVAYDHCPLQYKFAHILKIPVFGNHSMSFGKTMHNTLQEFFERKLESKTTTKKELLEIYESNWVDEWYEDDKTRKAYKQDGKESLERYYDKLKIENPTPLFLEKGFTVKIDDIVIRGRIDRIDKVKGGVEIIDYKTGSPKKGEKLSQSDKIQLLLYQLAAKDIFGLEPVKLTFHYLKDNSEISFLGTENEILKLKDEIRKRISAIRKHDFNPTPGYMCKFCDFKDICPFKSPQ